MTNDPLAELQAQRELHDERHGNLRAGCHPDHCPDARWLSLCDRLAAAASQAARETEQERDEHGSALETIETEVGEFFDNGCPEVEVVAMVRYALARLAAAERQRDATLTKIEQLKRLYEQCSEQRKYWHGLARGGAPAGQGRGGGER